MSDNVMNILLLKERELLSLYAMALGTECTSALSNMLRCCIETEYLTICAARDLFKRKGLSSPKKISEEQKVQFLAKYSYLD